MYVKTYMATNLITVDRQTKVLEALDLMKEHNIHRLPVVEGDKLIGLITERLIAESTPSKISSLSMHELNYLLTKTTVEDIMEKDVITIGPQALLEKAALLMRERNLGVLPVVEHGQRIVGIITDKDIFDAFIDILGYTTPGVRLALEVSSDAIGVVERLGHVYAEHQMNITQIVVYRQRGKGIKVIVHLETDDLEKVVQMTEQAQFDVIEATIKEA